MTGDPTEAQLRERGRPPSGGTWARRAALAVVAPIAFMAALELSLRAVGYGHPGTLFIPDEKPGFIRTNPDFSRTYFPAHFDIAPLSLRLQRHKDPGTFRIFVLGESAARGIPEPGFGFAALLRTQLRAAYPGRRLEVINLGIVAINSHVVYQVAAEVADLEPDLFVVYMGNNEVVGPFGPGSSRASWMPPIPVVRASVWVSRSRTGQAAANLVRWILGRNASETQWQGMTTFTRNMVSADDPRLQRVYSNLRANLTAILEVARNHRIGVVVGTVACNLRDCPPFASVHSPSLSHEGIEAWGADSARGEQEWELGNLALAARSLRSAIEEDPGYAENHYVLARVLDEQGDLDAARREYVLSLHLDALRFRPDPRVNAIIREVVAREPGTILVDAALELGSDPRSLGPVAGRDLFQEHVHPSWHGDNRLARLLAPAAAKALALAAPPQGSWLDDDACAAEVGYTEQGRFQVISAMGSILSKPPFTNQLTFAEDQLRYRQDLKDAATRAANPAIAARSEALLESAITRDPENPAPMLRLSEVEFALGRAEKALALIDRAARLEPPSPDLLLRRAHTLTGLKRPVEAQSEVLRAIRISPEHVPSFAELVDVVRNSEDFAAGKDAIEKAIAENPGSEFLRLQRADLLFFHGDQAEAEAECRAILGRDPASEEALGRLTSLLGAEGKRDQALALMEAARIAQPGNFANDMDLARAYEARKDDAQVQACLKLAARCGPAEPQVHVYLARRLLSENRPRDARLELERAQRGALIVHNQQMADAVAAMLRNLAGGQ